ncbi:MAG: hypothetical protein KME21_12175 [Desmonostoc vinosum HA7617-LM4]|nr:hypothetical protein [Desmonostoc vinosum HA7617-LM4]
MSAKSPGETCALTAVVHGGNHATCAAAGKPEGRSGSPRSYCLNFVRQTPTQNLAVIEPGDLNPRNLLNRLFCDRNQLTVIKLAVMKLVNSPDGVWCGVFLSSETGN